MLYPLWRFSPPSTDKHHAVPFSMVANDTIFVRNSATFISNDACQLYKQDNANHI